MRQRIVKPWMCPLNGLKDFPDKECTIGWPSEIFLWELIIPDELWGSNCLTIPTKKSVSGISAYPWRGIIVRLISCHWEIRWLGPEFPFPRLKNFRFFV